MFADVKIIISSVIDELQKNPDRRFIYVEMAFFTRWWNEQSQATQDIVRDLVETGEVRIIIERNCRYILLRELLGAGVHQVDLVESSVSNVWNGTGFMLDQRTSTYLSYSIG